MKGHERSDLLSDLALDVLILCQMLGSILINKSNSFFVQNRTKSGNY